MCGVNGGYSITDSQFYRYFKVSHWLFMWLWLINSGLFLILVIYIVGFVVLCLLWNCSEEVSEEAGYKFYNKFIKQKPRLHVPPKSIHFTLQIPHSLVVFSIHYWSFS